MHLKENLCNDGGVKKLKPIFPMTFIWGYNITLFTYTVYMECHFFCGYISQVTEWTAGHTSMFFHVVSEASKCKIMSSCADTKNKILTLFHKIVGT